MQKIIPWVSTQRGLREPFLGKKDLTRSVQLQYTLFQNGRYFSFVVCLVQENIFP